MTKGRTEQSSIVTKYVSIMDLSYRQRQSEDDIKRLILKRAEFLEIIRKIENDNRKAPFEFQEEIDFNEYEDQPRDYKRNIVENGPKVFCFQDKEDYGKEGQPKNRTELEVSRLFNLQYLFSANHLYQNPPKDNSIAIIDQKVGSHHAHVLLSAGEEFKRYSTEELKNGACRFIKTVVSFDCIGLSSLSTYLEEFYFDKAAYKEYVKNSLVKKLKVALAVHHQSEEPRKNLQFNISLFGKNDFFEVDSISIKSVVMPLIAEAYAEALQEFASFQNKTVKRWGKITVFRLTYCDEETEIAEIFKNACQTIEDIHVAISKEPVHDVSNCQKTLKPLVAITMSACALHGASADGQDEYADILAASPGLAELIYIQTNPYISQIERQINFGSINNYIDAKKDIPDIAIQDQVFNLQSYLFDLDKLTEKTVSTKGTKKRESSKKKRESSKSKEPNFANIFLMIIKVTKEIEKYLDSNQK